MFIVGGHLSGGIRLKKDGTRQQVIDKYEKWLLQQPDLIDQLSELKGKVLGCWCAPKRCHCEILARNDKSFSGDTLEYNITIKPFAPIEYINIDYTFLDKEIK